MCELREAILDVLAVFANGKENAIKSAELEKTFGIKGAVLRDHVNALRSEGTPICSSRVGYWFADNDEELLATKQNLLNRIAGMQRAIEGIDTYLKTSK
jgi:hypothetical protein